MHAWHSDRGGRESQRHELAVDRAQPVETGRSTRASRDSRTTATRSFFQTAEQMVAADTDSSVDIYERAGSTTTLISTGPAGGNGAFDADFYDASKDGSRAVFETNESLVSADTDTTKDVYERVGQHHEPRLDRPHERLHPDRQLLSRDLAGRPAHLLHGLRAAGGRRRRQRAPRHLRALQRPDQPDLDRAGNARTSWSRPSGAGTRPTAPASTSRPRRTW